MEQVQRQGAKTDKNSESIQKQDDGRPRHRARHVSPWSSATLERWGCATWRGRVSASARSLARFFIYTYFRCFYWGPPQLSFGDFLRVFSLGLANKKPQWED